MKYLLSALLAFTIIACQNDPSQNRNGETQSADSTADSTEVAVVTLADVLPPLEDELHVVKSNQESLIELESGVRVHIPKDAFVDEDGNPIMGSVTLKIKDMTSMAAILKSGIRMDATMENGELGIFQTAGMISIDADGLEIAPGKSIEIDFPAESIDEDFPLWRLNKETNEWEKVAETTEVSTVATKVSLDSSSSPSSVQSFNGSNTFINRRTNFDEIGWQPPRPVEYNANYRNQITSDFKSLNNLRPEFANMRPLFFQALDNSSMENFKKMPTNNIQLRISNSNNTYELVSYNRAKDDTLIAEVTWSYVPQQRARLQEYLAFIKKCEVITGTLEALRNHIYDERKNGFNDEVYQELYSEAEVKIERIADQNLKARTTAILRSLSTSRSCLREASKQQLRQLRASETVSALAKTGQQFRRVNIYSFGVYNCDRFWREPSQNFTLAFSSGTEKVELKLIKLIDMEEKSITDLTRFGTNSSYKLGIDCTYYLVGISEEGDPYLAKMNTQELKSGESNTIQIQKASTEEEIETFLAEMT